MSLVRITKQATACFFMARKTVIRATPTLNIRAKTHTIISTKVVYHTLNPKGRTIVSAIPDGRS